MTIDDPELRLVLSYVPRERRCAAEAILSLDRRLGTIVAATREPLVGQMRLTWWYDALHGLDNAPPPAEPLLVELARCAVPCGVRGADLAALVDGWEALLEVPLSTAAASRHADRGRAVFAVVGIAIGSSGDPLEAAGAGWALADLARHVTYPEISRHAAALAMPLLDQALAVRWSRAGRALGAVAHLARLDLVRPEGLPGSPHRVARMLRHRLTGR